MVLQRIKTREEIKKKSKQNQIIIGVVMIGLLVLATGGYSIMSSTESSNKVTDKGLKFYKDQEYGFWTTQVAGQNLAMQLLPSDVEEVLVEGVYSLEVYRGEPLYLVGDNLAWREIIGNLGVHVSRYQEACMIGSDCVEDLPIKDCDSNVIIFEEGNDTQVYREDNCVFLIGDVIQATDAFLYRLFGII
jgi:hypothetical protein